MAPNFCRDSFSQINCFGRCDNVSLVIGAAGFWVNVLILNPWYLRECFMINAYFFFFFNLTNIYLENLFKVPF